MKRRPLLCAAAWLLCAAPSAAQAPSGTADARPVETDYSQSLLRDLPSSDNVFSLLEVLQPTLITDRFTGGGLSMGQAPRVGGFLPSWTQTLFQIDGVSITDPTGSGTPLLFPDMAFVGRMRVQTGIMRGAQPRAGLTIDFAPVAAGTRWSGSAEAATARGALTSDRPETAAPSLARTDTWDRGSFTAAGPLGGGRGGIMFGASLASTSQIDRDLTSAPANLVSGIGSIALSISPREQLRVIGWLQRREQPLESRAVLRTLDAQSVFTGFHGQTVYERGTGRPSFRAFVSFTRRGGSQGDDVLASAGTLERLVDGPPQSFAYLADQSVRLWSAGASFLPRLSSGSTTHDLEASVDLTGGHSSTSAVYSGVIGETVAGLPARIWSFAPSPTDSRRGSTVFGASLSDRMAIGSRVRIEAGLRFDSSTGSADGATNGISWQTLLPHVSARVGLTPGGMLSAFAGYSRFADRLLLDYLAFGDPAAPTAAVSRWNAAPGTPVVVARVGPGTGGDPAFSRIDLGLERPVTDEVLLGIEARPRGTMLFRFTGVARSQDHLLGVVNVGVPFDAGYDTFTVEDPGSNVGSADDDKVLTIYDRRPAFFGSDQYLLTNPGQQSASFKGFEITLGYTGDRFSLIGGGTAGMAESTGASRGFGPLENDQSVLGEAFSDPNAATLARGRLFTDRAYTGKIATIVRLPADVRLGLIARYQDGQPFSRVVVAPQLRQGADAVRAFASGDSRFTFIGTVDMRLQKAFPVGASNVSIFFDAYNLLNMSQSVEEDAAQAPDDRVSTAVQPPRTMQLGVRVTF